MVSLILFSTYMVFAFLSEMSHLVGMHLKKKSCGFDPIIFHLWGLICLSTLNIDNTIPKSKCQRPMDDF